MFSRHYYPSTGNQLDGNLLPFLQVQGNFTGWNRQLFFFEHLTEYLPSWLTSDSFNVYAIWIVMVLASRPWGRRFSVQLQDVFINTQFYQSDSAIRVNLFIVSLLRKSSPSTVTRPPITDYFFTLIILLLFSICKNWVFIKNKLARFLVDDVSEHWLSIRLFNLIKAFRCNGLCVGKLSRLLLRVYLKDRAINKDWWRSYSTVHRSATLETERC